MGGRCTLLGDKSRPKTGLTSPLLFGFNDFSFIFCREIQMATGEWIHDYLNRGSAGGGNGGGNNTVKRNKSINNGQRLYVATQGLQPPTTVPQENRKNIKRSWTISSKQFLRLFLRIFKHYDRCSLMIGFLI